MEEEYDGWVVEQTGRSTWLDINTVSNTREGAIEKWLSGIDKKYWIANRKKGNIRCVKIKIQKAGA